MLRQQYPLEVFMFTLCEAIQTSHDKQTVHILFSH